MKGIPFQRTIVEQIKYEGSSLTIPIVLMKLEMGWVFTCPYGKCPYPLRQGTSPRSLVWKPGYEALIGIKSMQMRVLSDWRNQLTLMCLILPQFPAAKQITGIQHTYIYKNMNNQKKYKHYTLKELN